jgi:PAS domain S-box-containing protein
VPVRFEERVIGTLCVGTRQPRRFHSEDIELLSSIGNQIGVSIENARLYRQQRETAAQLQASEKRYRTLFESANDAIWVHDMAGSILAVNRACAELTDYSVEELGGMNVRSFLRDGGLALARQVRARLLRGEALDEPYEQVLIRKDGTEAVLRLSTSLVTREGRPTAFQHIARDVTEDKRIQRNLISHLQQVVRAQEEERKRIARELHDDTAQILGSLSREVDNFIRKKSYLLPDEVAFLKYLREQLNRGLQEVHRFSQDLRPSVLDDLGLSPALKSLVAKMKERSGIDVELRVVGRQRRFAPEVELLVFRIVQEALNNVKRHSNASKACVVVAFAEGRTRLTISDNGQGFELPRRTDDFLQCGKLGLAGMQERARLLGGTMEVHSAPGDGTTIILEIPE